jgi:major membrane immunogen (membrane-anchored lipoprotein)
LVPLIIGCDNYGAGLQDGYFTAISEHYDKEGWRDYLTIFVNNGAITTVEFNAVNATGFLKSWDMDYLSQAQLESGVNPNHYARLYANQLIALQDPEQIRGAVGGDRVRQIFTVLAKEAISQSTMGDFSLVSVSIPPPESTQDSQEKDIADKQ